MAKSTRLQDKYQQLVVGASGTPRYADVKCVYLRADGTLTGKVMDGVLSGAKVLSNSLSTRLWNVQTN